MRRVGCLSPLSSEGDEERGPDLDAVPEEVYLSEGFYMEGAEPGHVSSGVGVLSPEM